jgi:hypothetical protein
VPGAFIPSPVRREAWGLCRLLTVLFVLPFGFAAPGVAAGQSFPSRPVKNYKSDDEVIRRKSRSPQEVSSVIVRFAPGGDLPAEFKRFARVKGRLGIINGEVLDLPSGIPRSSAFTTTVRSRDITTARR